MKGFTEKIKIEVKKKSMFQCCRCHQMSVDVHHIIPQHQKGPSTIENAAPLCQNCHAQFGDNPSKRKEIKQMRDNWYEVVEKMYSPPNVLAPLVEKLNTKIEELKDDQRSKRADISEIKTTLKEISDKVIDSITPGTASVTASNIVKASGASLSDIDVNSFPKMMVCMECGEPSIVGEEGDPMCMECGEPLYH